MTQEIAKAEDIVDCIRAIEAACAPFPAVVHVAAIVKLGREFERAFKITHIPKMEVVQ